MTDFLVPFLFGFYAALGFLGLTFLVSVGLARKEIKKDDKKDE